MTEPPDKVCEIIRKPSFVYLLECTDGSTYVGATVDLDHRLRQHNKEITGGATATSIKVLRGHKWKRVCYVKNFPDWQAALQFEWRFKQISRKLTVKNPLERRKQALSILLSMERPTTKAKPYCEWPMVPEVVWE
jgi:structure-specific endonuclease subunit SLX1